MEQSSEYSFANIFKTDVHSSSYSGYIDIEARHLFFYFFESRNDPAKDDLIFWTNGGGFEARLGSRHIT